MPPVGVEPSISAGERQQIYVFDRAATGTGLLKMTEVNLHLILIEYRLVLYDMVIIFQIYLFLIPVAK
jgi:hypothetical protein